MKRRKVKPPFAKTEFYPWEADPFNAREALREGDTRGVGYFARDLGKALELLGRHCDPKAEQDGRPKISFGRNPHPKQPAGRKEREWEGTLLELQEAIETRNIEAVACYLREAGDFLSSLGTALDPPPRFRGLMLEFRRKGQGRPSDRWKVITDSAIRQAVTSATQRLGKREAAVAEIAEKFGISRPTIFRALDRRPENRRPESRKSGN